MSGMRAPPIAVTMGEPAGIGAEVVLKAWSALRRGGNAFYAIDDPERLRQQVARLGLTIPLAELL